MTEAPLLVAILFTASDIAHHIQRQEALVHLALRLAGLAWIVIEWVAAYYLIRTYRLCRHSLQEPDEPDA